MYVKNYKRFHSENSLACVRLCVYAFVCYAHYCHLNVIVFFVVVGANEYTERHCINLCIECVPYTNIQIQENPNVKQSTIAHAHAHPFALFI